MIFIVFDDYVDIGVDELTTNICICPTTPARLRKFIQGLATDPDDAFLLKTKVWAASVTARVHIWLGRTGRWLRLSDIWRFHPSNTEVILRRYQPFSKRDVLIIFHQPLYP